MLNVHTLLLDPPVEVHGAQDAQGNVKWFEHDGKRYVIGSPVVQWDDPRPESPRTFHAYTLTGHTGCFMHFDRTARKWYLWAITDTPKPATTPPKRPQFPAETPAQTSGAGPKQEPAPGIISNK